MRNYEKFAYLSARKYTDFMSQKENTIIKKHMLALDPESQRRFRINAGMGWAGSVIKGAQILSYLRKCGTGNCMLLVNPRPFIGAPEGFPDTIGFDSVVITEQMVGQRVAIFAADEFKTKNVRLSKAQKIFGDMVEKFGGIFRVIRG